MYKSNSILKPSPFDSSTRYRHLANNTRTGLLFRVCTQKNIYFFLNQNIHVVRPPDKSALLKKYFLYFLSKTYVVGTQNNRLIEMVLLSTPNHVKTDGYENIYNLTHKNFVYSINTQC